jgi:hypothetical protein
VTKALTCRCGLNIEQSAGTEAVALSPDHESAAGFQHQLADYLDRLGVAFQACSNFTNEEIHPDDRRVILRGVGEPMPVIAEIMKEAPDDWTLCGGQLRTRPKNSSVRPSMSCRGCMA